MAVELRHRAVLLDLLREDPLRAEGLVGRHLKGHSNRKFTIAIVRVCVNSHVLRRNALRARDGRVSACGTVTGIDRDETDEEGDGCCECLVNMRPSHN